MSTPEPPGCGSGRTINGGPENTVLMTTRAVARVQAKPVWRVLLGPLVLILLCFGPALSSQNAKATAKTGQTEQSTQTGTAFAIRPDGLFMTNLHVVREAKRIRLFCPGMGLIPAVVETSSPEHEYDLAVLKVSVAWPRRYLTFADPGPIEVGAKVFTIGYPVPGLLGVQPKYSEGVIIGFTGRWLQVSVPVHPGNSGGPLVNEKGEVVGVVVAMAKPPLSRGLTWILPQNISWAVKGQYAIALFQKHLPEIAERSAGLDRNAVIERVMEATCLVFVG